jgi:hypothetical protein
VARRAVGARDEDLPRLPVPAALEEAHEERDGVRHVKVRDRALSLPAEDVAVPGVREPRLEEHVERRVFALVREHGGEPHDHGREAVLVAADHRLADAFRLRVDVAAVRRARLVEGLSRRRQLAGRDGAGKEELLHPDAGGQVERVSQSVDVRSEVLGVLLSREVVVRREVDDDVGAAVLADLPEDVGERLAVPDVDLEPREVRVDGRAAARLRTARDSVNDPVVTDCFEEVASHEPGRTRENQSRQRHTGAAPAPLRSLARRDGRAAVAVA